MRLTPLIFAGFMLLTHSLVASPQLDSEFGYRNVVVAVVNLDKEPIYGEQVETDLLNELRRNSRFEVSDSGYILLREYLNKNAAPVLGREPATAALSGNIIPVLNSLRAEGVQAILLAEVQPKEGTEPPAVVLSLFKTTGEWVANSKRDVPEPRALASYTGSARVAIKDLFKSVPFEATVIRRDGYNVVLDRGAGPFRSGMNVPVYTIEKHDGDLLFEETGTINITRAESQLSFGKILVEKKPLEISVGNKIRLSRADSYALNDSVPLLNEDEDAPTSEMGEKFETTKGRFGMLNVNLIGSLLNLSNTMNRSSGGRVTPSEYSLTKIAPGISFLGELWLTSRLFFELGYKYAFSKIKYSAADIPPDGASQSVSVNKWDFALGYRLNLTAPEAGPILHAKLGFGGHTYSFDDTSPVIFTTTHYSGLILGGGVNYQFDRKLSFGVDLNTLIFVGVEESPTNRGSATEDVSAWQIAFKGSYSFDEQLDFQGTLFFEQNGATFAGNQDIASTVNATSQSAKGILAGVAYYF